MTPLENLEGVLGQIPPIFGERRKYGTFPGGKLAGGDGRMDINPDFVTLSSSGQEVTRGGFTIHGGNAPGSAGCIDVCGEYGFFKQKVEQFKGDASQIYLEVRYNSAVPVKSPFNE